MARKNRLQEKCGCCFILVTIAGLIGCACLRGCQEIKKIKANHSSQKIEQQTRIMPSNCR